MWVGGLGNQFSHCLPGYNTVCHCCLIVPHTARDPVTCVCMYTTESHSISTDAVVYLVVRQPTELCLVALKVLQEIAVGTVHCGRLASMVMIESGEAKKVGVDVAGSLESQLHCLDCLMQSAASVS